MHCTLCGTKCELVLKESWSNKLRCPKCKTRFEQIFPDRMGGYYRQYLVSVFDPGFKFKEEEE
jgi:hypothetical protein